MLLLLEVRACMHACVRACMRACRHFLGHTEELHGSALFGHCPYIDKQVCRPASARSQADISADSPAASALMEGILAVQVTTLFLANLAALHGRLRRGYISEPRLCWLYRCCICADVGCHASLIVLRTD